jgi:LysR family transcriptional regulator, transcriptional activator for leuABCD operon
MLNLRSLDLNLLTVFEAIYELETVSNAADHLALSQSATSHALSRLRKACGDELFVRGHKGLAPTPTAKAMYPVVKQALEALRTSLAEAMGFDPATSRRHFRLSIPHPMAPFFALGLRKTVAAVAPGIVLTFDTASRPVNLEESLRDGISDVAIDWLPVELDPFVNRKLFDDRIVLVTTRNHPRVRAGITVEELRKEEFIGLHHRREAAQMPQALKQLHDLQFHTVVYVSEQLEIPTVVASTDLVALMPASMGPLMQQRLGLQVIPVPVKLPTLPVYMIWHETRRQDTAHRWLRDLVAADVGRLAGG